MTRLQRWLLAGTMLQALQVGAAVAGVAMAGVDSAPASVRDGMVVAQAAPTEEELRRRRPPQGQPGAAPPPQAAPPQAAPRQAPPPQAAPPRVERPMPPPQAAPQRQERPMPPPQAAPQRQERPTPPPQVMPQRQERPTPPPQVTPQRQERPTPPPQVMPQRQERPTPPPQVEAPRPPSTPMRPDGVRPQPPTPPAPDMPRRGPQGGPPEGARPGPQGGPQPVTPDGRTPRPPQGAPQAVPSPTAPQVAPPQPGAAQPTPAPIAPQVAPPPQPGGPGVAPQGLRPGPQGGPPPMAPDGRPRPPQGGPQVGPQGGPPQPGGPGGQIAPPPPGGPQVGPQGRGPGFGPGGQPPRAPAVVPANPMPPGPPPNQARRGNDRNNGRNAAIGAAAGFVGGFIAGSALGSINDVRDQRRVVDQNGVRYYQEPGRTIIRDGDNLYIRHDETERFRNLGIRMRDERRDGLVYSSYVGEGGITVVTVTSPDGQLLKRYRRYPNGREVIIIDNTFRGRDRIFDPEVVYIAPPPVIIPRERYIVEAEDVDEGVIEDVFRAPPIARVERRYTLDEVRQSHGLRSYMPSVDVDTITFATGSWEVTYEQANKLSTIAEAIKRTLQSNPSEVYLVEGYTDAVGNDEDNLSLSDRRAQSVAAILTKNFGIPAENLTTQGYGEQYLKVDTQEAEQANRRVTVRRITPLLTGQAQQ